MPTEFDQWPSGIRDTTEFPSVNISLNVLLREHLRAFCSMDGLGWNAYDDQREAGGLTAADSRMRTNRKMYERLGLIFKQDDTIKLSRLGLGIRDLEKKLEREKENLLEELRRTAIDILARYQLRNPIDEPDLPVSCDVQPCLCIWKAMYALDGKINHEEMNRVILRILKMEDLDAAIVRIRDARTQYGDYSSLSDSEKNTILGLPVHTDQPTARIAAWFSFAGWGGLVIEQNEDEDHYHRLVTGSLDLLSRKLAAPPAFFETNDKDEWLAYYIGSASITEAEREELETEPDENTRVKGATNTLLYGVPGAGKSWTIANDYCDDENRMERLVFHPDYTYSDFIGQILPNVDDKLVTYRFTPGPFTKLLRRAYWNPTIEYFLIIEEINRGNAPAIFGEVFQLLDRDENGTSVYGISNADVARIVYGDEHMKVRIPSNMFIIGTMNTSDQNVFTLDTAFQRRWDMRLIENTFVGHRYREQVILDTGVTWQRFVEVINHEIVNRNIQMTSSEDKRLGTYFIRQNDLVLDPNADNGGVDERVKTKARLHNYKFAEKVLKYLWDDAFKFNRDALFKNTVYLTLEDAVDRFNGKDDAKAHGRDRWDIFNDEIIEALYSSDGQ